ncbi:MAG: hypothetical protein U5L01_07455 [Rheinheimera sp.]|nr:hypothetical protein [Rheinheimera sp.]
MGGKTDACGDVVESGCPVGIEETQPFSASLQLWLQSSARRSQYYEQAAISPITFKDITGKIVLSEKKSNQRMQVPNRRKHAFNRIVHGRSAEGNGEVVAAKWMKE